jgi:hypothetical protein
MRYYLFLLDGLGITRLSFTLILFFFQELDFTPSAFFRRVSGKMRTACESSRQCLEGGGGESSLILNLSLAFKPFSNQKKKMSTASSPCVEFSRLEI